MHDVPSNGKQEAMHNPKNCAPLGQVERLVRWILQRRTAELWHPESPGGKVTVTRTWVGRIFKPISFATLAETMKDGIDWVDMTCPICGHYCLGNGGHGCIDKPSFMVEKL